MAQWFNSQFPRPPAQRLDPDNDWFNSRFCRPPDQLEEDDSADVRKRQREGTSPERSRGALNQFDVQRARGAPSTPSAANAASSASHPREMQLFGRPLDQFAEEDSADVRQHHNIHSGGASPRRSPGPFNQFDLQGVRGAARSASAPREMQLSAKSLGRVHSLPTASNLFALRLYCAQADNCMNFLLFNLLLLDIPDISS